MNYKKILLIMALLSSCATVVKTDFDITKKLSPPTNKVSISITVFKKLYDKEGEFYGYGYQPNLTKLFVSTFKKSQMFTKVYPLTSTCSESYICLDVPTSKKIRAQRHVHIIMPSTFKSIKTSGFSTFLSAATLGLVPESSDISAKWTVNLLTRKRHLLYADDKTYKGSVKRATWLNFDDQKINNTKKEKYLVFYKKVSLKILENIVFQVKRFAD